MKTHASITIKNKTYPYSLEKVKDGVVKLISKDANINQEFLAEDLSLLILDLPNLILAEQKYTKSDSDIIRFRVTNTDKIRIEKKAAQNGYDSVSGYLRDLALS